MSKDKFQLRIEWVAPTGERFKTAEVAELWCKLQEAKEQLPEALGQLATQIFKEFGDLRHFNVLLRYCEHHYEHLVDMEAKQQGMDNSR